MKVFVVAWESEGSAGFDWYYTAEKADEAFEAEKHNADEFADERWTAYRFDYTASSDVPDEITEELHDIYPDLCDQATRLYPEPVFDEAEMIDSVLDNGGETYDRYTINVVDRHGAFYYLMSGPDGNTPRGVFMSESGIAEPNDDEEEIDFCDLPEPVQRAVKAFCLE